MLWRALLAFLALPGMVAFAVPLSLAWSESARRGAPLRPAGGLVVLAGASLLLWCVREFYVAGRDRKSTRLNSSHVKISYAVFCLKKKNIRSGRQRASLRSTLVLVGCCPPLV